MIAICLVVLVGLYGWNMYTTAKERECLALSQQPTFTVRVTGHRWSFADGCEVQIVWSHKPLEPEWTKEWLFRGVHTVADD